MSNYHDDSNDPPPDGGYCPVCLDVAMEVMGGFEDEGGIYMTLKCPACDIHIDWQSTNDPLVPIPLFAPPETEEEIDAFLRAHGYDPDALVERMRARMKKAMDESPLNPKNGEAL